MKTTYRLAEIESIATKLLNELHSRVLLFYGKMGSGKTTLIKEIAAQLGVKDLTNSPTFSLVNEYVTGNGEPMYHFDFYRIEREEEAYDMGFEEYLDSGSWCLIEWPEKVENLLPLDSAVIRIEINPDDSRTIQLTENA